MKKRAFTLAAGILVLAAAPLPAKERLYDDFNGRTISFGKWKGAGGDFWMAETRRDIARNGTDGNRLHLAMTAYSPQRDDGLGTGGIWGLYFANPDMKGATYDVKVQSATARACPGNPSAEVVTGPEFRGRFFNTQSNPSSELGDVEVAVGFDRRPDDVGGKLTAAFIYQMCNDANCTSHTTLAQGTFGTVDPGTTNNIGVHWENNRHRFIFELNGAKTMSHYSVSDASPPFAPDKEIDVARNIANCAERPRPYTAVDAYFDNIVVDR
jgi:hypothetical protein